MPERAPNVGTDPINPAYYAGTACAEIIERMPTNVGFAAKYAWRLGEKDSEIQEAGKAIWYLRRQLVLRYHENNLEHDFRWFASSRIATALATGKLTQDRADILVELVNYCLDGADHHLSHAIGIFETYIGE